MIDTLVSFPVVPGLELLATLFTRIHNIEVLGLHMTHGVASVVTVFAAQFATPVFLRSRRRVLLKVNQIFWVMITAIGACLARA